MAVRELALTAAEPRKGDLHAITHDALEVEDMAADVLRALRMAGFKGFAAVAVDGRRVPDLEVNAVLRAVESERWSAVAAGPTGSVTAKLRREGEGLTAALRFEPPLGEDAAEVLQRRLSATLAVTRLTRR